MEQWQSLRGYPLVLGVAILILPAWCQGQLTAIPDLTPPQAESARASQAIYNTLRAEGEQDALPAGQQALFRRLEELVHTANEQQAIPGEPTDRSLRVDEAELAEALDWVANEEAGSGSGLTVNAAHAQFSHVVQRLAMLQAQETVVAHAGEHGDTVAFGASEPFGGGAAGDRLAGPWGGFVLLSYGRVERDPTDRENAYDADQFGITAGVDYRVSDSLVAGVSLGYRRAELDFDDSRSVVDGDMTGDTFAFSGYALYEEEDFYLTSILTLGRMDIDLKRGIIYRSDNPDVPDTDETAVSSTAGNYLLLGVGGGYQFDLEPMRIGPVARLDLLRVELDSYRERQAGPFNLDVSRQNVDSLRSSLGMEASYPVATGFGVLIPQFRAEWHHEFRGGRRDVESRFVDDPQETRFVASGDRPDRNFYSISAALTAILPHGWQAFAQAETLLGMRHTSAYNLTAGARLEF